MRLSSKQPVTGCSGAFDGHLEVGIRRALLEVVHRRRALKQNLTFFFEVVGSRFETRRDHLSSRHFSFVISDQMPGLECLYRGSMLCVYRTVEQYPSQAYESAAHCLPKPYKHVVQRGSTKLVMNRHISTAARGRTLTVVTKGTKSY